MANIHSTNFLDRLFIKLDGTIAPIWNSIVCTVNAELLNKELIEHAFLQLLRENAFLNVIWHPRLSTWQTLERSDEELLSFTYFRENFTASKQQIIETIINKPVDLTKEVPLRVWLIKSIDHHQSLFIFQMHHARGDGRALFSALQRFWEICASFHHRAPLMTSMLMPCQLTNKRIIKYCLNQLRFSLVRSFLPRYRQLAKRASGLQHEGTQVGEPTFASLWIKLPSNNIATKQFASLRYFSALLAAIANFEERKINKLIRLRIPIDMRKSFGIPHTSIENAASAVPLELDLRTIRTILHNNPLDLSIHIQTQLQLLLNKQIPLNTFMECLLLEKLITKDNISTGTVYDILNPTRSNTLVTTFLGHMEKYFAHAKPFAAVPLLIHTPTWGSNAFLYGNRMQVNFTTFKGVWDYQRLNQFAAIYLQQIKTLYGYQGEMVHYENHS